MEHSGKHHCQLCLNLVSDEHFEEIRDGTRAILNFLLLRPSSDERCKQIMCNSCSLKITTAFTFKSMCLCTDNIVIPYVDNETGCSVDLKEVYAKETEKKPLIDTLDGYKVCRLCMQLIKDEFWSICDTKIDMIEKYIPEINFSVVKDPVICMQCFDYLNTHSSFIRSCLEIEEKCKSTHSTKGPTNLNEMLSLDSCIKTEEMDIKSEGGQEEELIDIDPIIREIEDKETSNKIEWMKINEQDEDKKSDVCFYVPDEDRINECKTEDRETTKNNIYEHKEGQGILVKNKVERNKCKYNAKYNSRSVSHKKKRQLQHKDTPEEQLHECGICGFITKHKGSLICHFVTHKNNSEVRMYECDTCAFTTKHKRSLVKHQQLHTEVLKYECDICDYKAKCNLNLVNHQLVHKDPSEMQMYECDTCAFKTKHKRSLVNHQLLHTDPAEVQRLECDMCDFKAKCKLNLVNHQLIHKDPSEVQMYECDTCGLKCKGKRNLKDHQLLHGDSCDVKMFKCDTCGYESKTKFNLLVHQKKHKPSEVAVYKCNICHYETKSKKCLVLHKCKQKQPLKWKLEVVEKINESIFT